MFPMTNFLRLKSKRQKWRPNSEDFSLSLSLSLVYYFPRRSELCFSWSPTPKSCSYFDVSDRKHWKFSGGLSDGIWVAKELVSGVWTVRNCKAQNISKPRILGAISVPQRSFVSIPNLCRVLFSPAAGGQIPGDNYPQFFSLGLRRSLNL